MWIRNALLGTVVGLVPLATPFSWALGAQAERARAARPESATAEVLRVVDGDTVDVRLDGAPDGAEVTLRLLSVDTEEKIAGRPSAAPSKPETVFGQETALWAQALFASFAPPVRVELAFPEGRRDDAYGRLLCHVILPDGRDYNLMLVEQGKSPYFNKYGNSLTAHAAFVRAQAAARERALGIWDPATNRARTPGAHSAVRPYERLLPWWDARAAAIDGFRARAAREPELVSAEDPAGLQHALERGRNAAEARVTVFGAIERFFEEEDGALTVLLRSGDPRTALRARVAASERAVLEPFLRASTAEFRQNYLYVRGRVERNARGFLLTGSRRSDWIAAEPAHPPPEPR